MTIRKRRNPTPFFRLPPPYNPLIDAHANLAAQGDYPYCALFQVAAEDTEDDYVICRGYDPRIRKFINYDSEDENKPGIPIAKPFSNRKAGVYEVGEIFPAVLPLTRLGQNSGVAATSQGQPADLDEEVELLYTSDGKVVTWIFLDSGGGSKIVFGILSGVLNQGSTATMDVYAGSPLADTGENITVKDWFLGSGETLDIGTKIIATKVGDTYYVIQSACPAT
jgi:hypothetical protein